MASTSFGSGNSGYQIATNNGVINVSPGSSDNECLSALLSTHPVVSDPFDHMRSIEHAKGGLLEASYEWVLRHPTFLQLQNNSTKRFLSIRGSPGHGKTMLLIGIIKYLTISFPETKLAYFFCQGSNALMNSSNSVLRGLIYRLLCDQPSLIAHLREKYDRHKSMFQDGSSFFALSEVASHMLRDPEIGRIYIIIDALDECETNRNQILDFISQNLDVSPSVKWIVSTRKVPAIIDRLGQFNLNIQLHLDLADNTEDVSLAVNAYIIVKVASLPALRENNQQILHVQTVMHEKAANTFLWAALVFQELETAEEWDIFDIIDSIPSGLEDLYARMMDQIQKLGRGNSELCHKILATATLAHRPLFMAEIGALADLPDRIANIMERVRRIINMCGSFLRIQDDTVQFVHQSAKDYLNDTAGAIIFKSPQNDAHFRLYMRSIQLMSVNLSRNIYRLPYPGILIDDIQRPEPDPLGQLRYSCVYWVQHLCYGMQEITSIGVLRDGKELPTFFKQHLLHWLEALSLMGAMGEGISAIIRLQTALKGVIGKSTFQDLLQDVYRFLLQNGSLIRMAPLQTYSSALLFSPRQCLTRKVFQAEEPKWILEKPTVDEHWSPLMQTLEGGSPPDSIVFSPDSQSLASGLLDGIISVWDVRTGLLKHRLGAPTKQTLTKFPIAFSRGSRLLASARWGDEEIVIWDIAEGVPKHVIRCDTYIEDMEFSPDSRLLCAGNRFGIQTWYTETWVLAPPFRGCQTGWVSSLSFSRDSMFLASIGNKRLDIWHMPSASHQQSLPLDLEPDNPSGYLVQFSPDSQVLAACTRDMILIWDISSGSVTQRLEGHVGPLDSLKFSQDSKFLASASNDGLIRIWNTSTWTTIRTLQGEKLTLSHDGALFASVSSVLERQFIDGHISIWDMTSLTGEQGSNRQVDTLVWNPSLDEITFSADLKRAVSWSFHSPIMRFIDTSSGAIEKELSYPHEGSVIFSRDLNLFAWKHGFTFYIGETSSESIRHSQTYPANSLSFVADFSADSKHFTLYTFNGDITVLNLVTGKLATLPGIQDSDDRSLAVYIALSPCSRFLALSSASKVRIWDLKVPSQEPLIKRIKEKDVRFGKLAFSHNSKYLAALWTSLSSHHGGSTDWRPISASTQIWKIDTTALGQSLDVVNSDDTHMPITNLTFDSTSLWLDAAPRHPGQDREDRNVDQQLVSHTIDRQGFTFNSIPALSWIGFRGQNLLYLPTDFRPIYLNELMYDVDYVRHVAISRDLLPSPTTTIVVRSRTGRVWRIKLSDEEVCYV